MTQYKVITPRTLGLFLSQQEEKEDAFFIPEYNLFVFSRQTEEGYSLLFVLGRPVVLDRRCENALEWSRVDYVKKDVPWMGFSTRFMFALLPINCEKNIVMPAVRVEIGTGDTVFHWDQIVNILFTEELINYLEKIRNEFGVEYQILNT